MTIDQYETVAAQPESLAMPLDQPKSIAAPLDRHLRVRKSDEGRSWQTPLQRSFLSALE